MIIWFLQQYFTKDQQLYLQIEVKLESRKDLSNQGDELEGEGEVVSFLEDKSLRTSHKV